MLVAARVRRDALGGAVDDAYVVTGLLRGADAGHAEERLETGRELAGLGGNFCLAFGGRAEAVAHSSTFLCGYNTRPAAGRSSVSEPLLRIFVPGKNDYATHLPLLPISRVEQCRDLVGN